MFRGMAIEDCCLSSNTWVTIWAGGEMADYQDGGHMLTVELRNSKPVDLMDFTDGLMALAEEFRDYAADSAADPVPGNVRLYIREMRQGSIVADLMPVGEQLSWVLDHKDVVAGFVTHIKEITQYFLGAKGFPKPNSNSAGRISRIMEPVAKDSGSQINIIATDNARVDVHQHFHAGFLEAGAVQNSVSKMRVQELPSVAIQTDKIMTLEQVKNDAAAKTGDRGVIESIWGGPVKLQFMNEQAKSRVISIDENPFQKAFVVDVEVKTARGRPIIYRILEVREVIDI